MLLVSDANILIDIEIGGLIASMFSLDHQFAVPDVLFYAELETQHAYLLRMGLEIRTFNESMVGHVFEFSKQYKRVSTNDLFALLLAVHEECPLLTGDKNLREVAKRENVQVFGTLWLVTEMVKKGRITVSMARDAYQKMNFHGRRLPWDQAERLLFEMEAELIEFD